MRVLLISHTCQSRTAGQPKAQAIAAEPGIDLTVLVPRRWKVYGKWSAAEDLQAAKPFRLLIQDTRLPWVPGAQNYLHHYPSLKQILLEERPDVIDVWEEPWSWVSVQVCRLRERYLPGAKVISETEQNIDKKLPPPFAQFRRYVAARADFLVGRNNESLEVMRSHGYRGRNAVVGNAVDESLFRPMDRGASKAAIGVSGFVIGYVGRLVEEKGLDELVESLAILPPDCKVLLVGDGAMVDRLRQRAKQLNVDQRLVLRPFVPADQLPAVMNAMDVLVLPSRTTTGWKEQFGRVLIEAMACGVPVIGSTSGGIPEVIGDAGLLFPERDVDALAGAILQLHDSRNFASEIARKGRDRVSRLYTWSAVGRQMCDIYRSLVQQSHAVSKVDVA
jgi:glycosyltransferase involved in cell wall biosynthesis